SEGKAPAPTTTQAEGKRGSTHRREGNHDRTIQIPLALQFAQAQRHAVGVLLCAAEVRLGDLVDFRVRELGRVSSHAIVALALPVGDGALLPVAAASGVLGPCCSPRFAQSALLVDGGVEE